MKKGKKKVDLHWEHTTLDHDFFLPHIIQEYTYVFKSNENIDVRNLECFIEIDVPETISEFREMHNLSKGDLIEWLNENYKNE